jgi:hypothetical protein
MPASAERFTADRVCAIVAPKTVKIEAVSQISSLRKVGIALRVVRNMAGRSPRVNAAISAVRATGRTFAHILHLLWLEVMGTVFLAMAGVGGIALAREYAKYAAGRATGGRLVLAVCFTLTFAWFGLSSFWRVRRKSQRP